MKKVIYSILITLLLTAVLVCCSTFSNSESLTKRYIKNFLYPERYMKVDSGDFISREEVEQTMVRKDSDNRLLTVSSYMYDGTKFWAKNRYVIGEKIEQRPQNENYKTKVTQIVNHDTKVKGTGKFTDPWIFVDSFKVTVSTSDNGTIDGQKSVTKNVDSNGNVSFTIEPKSGYKYLNNDCGGNSEVAGNILTISNIEKDISCVVSFEVSKYSNTLPVPYKVVHINLTNSNVTYKFDNPSPTPNTFSAIYSQGYYTDDTLKTRIGKLTNVPSRKGWKFKGYYVKRSNFSKLDEIASTDELLINDKGFFETSYGLLKDNTNREVIGFSIEPNKYKITFNKTGGNGGTPYVENWPYEHDMPEITIPGRAGYTFNGYYTASNGGGDKYYNADGTASRIFNPNTPGDLALYANWKECGKGNYCPGDNIAHACPNGYKDTETTTSTKCSDCRYWDPCHTGHNTCRYGCGTCCSSYSYVCGQSCVWGFNYGAPGGHCVTYRYSYCYGTSCSSCNCSSCYTGENTCKGAWVYNTSCSEGTIYTVNLDKQGGTGGDDSFTITYYGSNVKVNADLINTPNREGYVFEGYYTKTNGQGEKIIDITNSTTGFVSTPDIKVYQSPSGTTFTLYANWTKCDKGSYCPGDNTSNLCDSGTYQDEEGQPNCKNCGLGTYNGIKGSTICSKCLLGTFQDEESQSSCKSCPEGTYQDKEGQTSCKDCVAGSYSTEGLDRCIACLNGKTSDAKSGTCPKDCSNNANVNQWETATWNSDDTVTNNCKIKSCKTGYRLDNNTCVKSTFTVTYNNNGGSGTMNPSTAIYNENFVTSKNTFTKTGYKFIGWNEKSDGSGVAWNLNSNGVYENGNGSHPIKWTYERDITLYAQWEKIKEFVAVTNSSTVSKIQTGSCDGSGCYEILFASITGITCTNNSNNTTTCVFSTKVEQTGGINTYANTMYLKIFNGSTEISSKSCEIKPYTSYGKPDTWNRTCSISFPTPTANVTYKYRAIVNNNGCILNGHIRNTAWGNCNELTGQIKNY